jgi:hypothetical protein
MAIISEKEEFLLKFKQESSNDLCKPLEVSVTKVNNIYILDIKQDKRTSSIKIDLDSFSEILNYINSKVHKSSHLLKREKEPENNSSILDANVQYGMLDDLLKDIEEDNSSEQDIRYNSQADVIIANGVNMSMLGNLNGI